MQSFVPRFWLPFAIQESNPILTQTASLTANGLDSFHTIFDSPAAVAAALALTPAVAGGAETSTVSTPVFSRSGNGGSSTAMEEFYAVPKPVELKPQGATSAAPVGLRGVAAAEGAAAVGNEEDTKAVLALGQKPKWMREVSRISSPMLRLHQGEERLLLWACGEGLHTARSEFDPAR